MLALLILAPLMLALLLRKTALLMVTQIAMPTVVTNTENHLRTRELKSSKILSMLCLND